MKKLRARTQTMAVVIATIAHTTAGKRLRALPPRLSSVLASPTRRASLYASEVASDVAHCVVSMEMSFAPELAIKLLESGELARLQHVSLRVRVGA